MLQGAHPPSPRAPLSHTIFTYYFLLLHTTVLHYTLLSLSTYPSTLLIPSFCIQRLLFSPPPETITTLPFFSLVTLSPSTSPSFFLCQFMSHIGLLHCLYYSVSPSTLILFLSPPPCLTISHILYTQYICQDSCPAQLTSYPSYHWLCPHS